jgi:hypothetical protein
MSYRKKFLIAPGSRIRLTDFDPQFTDKHEDKHSALPKVAKLRQRMDEVQFQLHAEQRRSLRSTASSSNRRGDSRSKFPSALSPAWAYRSQWPPWLA